MKKLLVTIGLAVCALPAFSQKVTTITAISTNGGFVTNTFAIPAGEAARVVTLYPVQWSFGQGPGDGGFPTTAGRNVALLKDGGVVLNFLKGDVVHGPATFVVWASSSDATFAGPGTTLLTIERWRVPKIVPVRLN